jgi:hypothetical protein
MSYLKVIVVLIDMKGSMISEFCEKTKRALQGNLYGIVLYGNPEGEDIDLVVVPHVGREEDMKRLRELKIGFEKRYKNIKLDLLYLTPCTFFEALSRMTAKLGKVAILRELRVCYNSFNFYQLILLAIETPIDKPPIKTDDYRIR